MAPPLAWLAAAFGLRGPVDAAPVARGAMGRVWRIVGADGPRAAKELFWAPPTAEKVARELDFAAACRRVGVPSPAGIAGADGSPLQVEPGTGRTWRLYEWADGVEPPHADVASAEWLSWCLARMHLLAEPPGAEVDPWYRLVATDWVGLAERASRAGVSWADLLRSRLPDLLSEFSARVNSAPERPAVYTHTDACTMNTLVAGTGPRERRWLVDWDNCGPLAAAHEVGRLVQDHYRYDEEVRRIVAAYRAAGGPADLTDRHLLVAAQAIWLNYVAMQAELLLDPTLTDPDQCTYAESGLRLLSEIPTPGQVDHTLATVRRM